MYTTRTSKANKGDNLLSRLKSSLRKSASDRSKKDTPSYFGRDHHQPRKTVSFSLNENPSSPRSSRSDSSTDHTTSSTTNLASSPGSTDSTTTNTENDSKPAARSSPPTDVLVIDSNNSYEPTEDMTQDSTIPPTSVPPVPTSSVASSVPPVSSQDTVLEPGFTSLCASANPTYDDTPPDDDVIYQKVVPTTTARSNFPISFKPKALKYDSSNGWIETNRNKAKNNNKQGSKPSLTKRKRTRNRKKASIQVGMTVSGRIGRLIGEKSSNTRRVRENKIAKVIKSIDRNTWLVMDLNGSTEKVKSNRLTIEYSKKYDDIVDESVKKQSYLTDTKSDSDDTNDDVELLSVGSDWTSHH